MGKVSKKSIPALLKKLVQTSFKANHFKSGFKGSGLYPMHRDKVMAKFCGESNAFAYEEESDQTSLEPFQKTRNASTPKSDKQWNLPENTADSLLSSPPSNDNTTTNIVQQNLPELSFPSSTSMFEKMPTSSASAINEVTPSRRMTASVIKYLQTVHAKKNESKKSRKRLCHALGQSLMEPEVLAQLTELREAKKAKKARSTNVCRICRIQWTIYKKKYKKDWACCDRCDGWICGNCLADDFDPTGDFVCQVCITHNN